MNIRERGSVLFMLFIAVALFGMLSYAFMRGSRNDVAMLSDEQAKIYAQNMIAYAADIKTAVKRMQLRGITETQLDFYNGIFLRNDGAAITDANGTCTQNACKVFSNEGGGIAAVIPQGPATPYSGPGTTWRPRNIGFRVTKVDGVGTSAPDLLLLAVFVPKEVCIKINDLLNVTNPSGNPPVDANGTYNEFSGTIATFPNPAGYGLGDEAAVLSGRTMFCVLNNVGGVHWFWAVILSR